jgi:hypothetical protein
MIIVALVSGNDAITYICVRRIASIRQELVKAIIYAD